MPEEELAANVPAEGTAPVESAPIENQTPTEPPVESGENQPNPQPPQGDVETDEKFVPLTALQQERDRRKSAEQYAKQFGYGLEPEVPDYEPPVVPMFDPQFQPSQPVEQQVPSQTPFMTRDEYEFKERERNDWAKVTKTLPEFEQNPELLDFAEARRTRSLLKDGRYLTPMEAARQTVDLFKKSRAEGQKSAQESVTIQQMGSLESSGGTKVDDKATAKAELVKKIKNPTNQKEQQSALHEYLKNN